MREINEKARRFFVIAQAEMLKIKAKTKWTSGCVEHDGDEVSAAFFYAADTTFDVRPEDEFKAFAAQHRFRARQDVSVEDGQIVARLTIVIEDDEEGEGEGSPAEPVSPDVIEARKALVRDAVIYGDEVRLPAADPSRFQIKIGCGPEHLRSMAWLPINAFTDADFSDEDGEDGHAENAFLPPVEIDSDIPDRPW